MAPFPRVVRCSILARMAPKLGVRLSRWWYDRKHPPHPEPLWAALRWTGNGIGLAPESLRALPGMDADGFEEVLCGDLYDRLWHQGTIYAATPFAAIEVLQQVASCEPTHQAQLLIWVRDCMDSEELGACDGMHAGVRVKPEELEDLRAVGSERPTIAVVLRDHSATLRSLVADSADATARDVANQLLSRIGA